MKKRTIKLLVIGVFALTLVSCEKDEIDSIEFPMILLSPSITPIGFGEYNYAGPKYTSLKFSLETNPSTNFTGTPDQNLRLNYSCQAENFEIHKKDGEVIIKQGKMDYSIDGTNSFAMNIIIKPDYDFRTLLGNLSDIEYIKTEIEVDISVYYKNNDSEDLVIGDYSIVRNLTFESVIGGIIFD